MLELLEFPSGTTTSKGILHYKGYIYLFQNSTNLSIFQVSRISNINIQFLKIVQTNLKAGDSNFIERTSIIQLINENTVLLVVSGNNICLFNLTDLASPNFHSCTVLQTSLQNSYYVFDVKYFSGLLFASLEINGLDIYNSTTLEKITNLGINFFNTTLNAIQILSLDVNIQKQILYVVDNYNGLQIIDLSNGTNFKLLATLNYSGGIYLSSYDDIIILTGITQSLGMITLYSKQFMFLDQHTSNYSQNFVQIREDKNLAGMQGINMDDKFSLLIMNNLFYIVRTQISSEIVPSSEDISLQVIEKDLNNAIIFSDAENCNTRYISIIRDKSISISSIKESPPVLFCYPHNKINSTKYDYRAQIMDVNCSEKIKANDSSFNSRCIFNFNISVIVEDQIFKKDTQALIIGLAFGLSVACIMFIFCIYYFKKTKTYKKLINENQHSKKEREQELSGKPLIK